MLHPARTCPTSMRLAPGSGLGPRPPYGVPAGRVEGLALSCGGRCCSPRLSTAPHRLLTGVDLTGEKVCHSLQIP